MPRKGSQSRLHQRCGRRRSAFADLASISSWNHGRSRPFGRLLSGGGYPYPLLHLLPSLRRVPSPTYCSWSAWGRRPQALRWKRFWLLHPPLRPRQAGALLRGMCCRRPKSLRWTRRWLRHLPLRPRQAGGGAANDADERCGRGRSHASSVGWPFRAPLPGSDLSQVCVQWLRTWRHQRLGILIF